MIFWRVPVPNPVYALVENECFNFKWYVQAGPKVCYTYNFLFPMADTNTCTLEFSQVYGHMITCILAVAWGMSEVTSPQVSADQLLRRGQYCDVNINCFAQDQLRTNRGQDEAHREGSYGLRWTYLYYDHLINHYENNTLRVRNSQNHKVNTHNKWSWFEIV